MMDKLAKKRSQGRGGWEDAAQCTVESLCVQLVEHVKKGDPVDIAIFCMMIWTRSQEAPQQIREALRLMALSGSAEAI